MIPSIDPATGLLPAGTHAATMDEVHDAFVVNAPHETDRAVIFDALTLWCSQARRLFGGGTVWLDGGFVTHKAAAPHDADLVFIPQDVAQVAAAIEEHLADAMGLLTMQNVMWEAPWSGFGRRVQPMGGLIDAFLVDPRQPAQVDLWRETWSRVKLPDGTLSDTLETGFLEVVI